MQAPTLRPSTPLFSSGPCTKRPGWTPNALKGATLGRNHRSSAGKKKLKEAIERTKALLGVPEDYRVGIVPGSDTGAFEMAMWSLLGPVGVDVLVWESFGLGWANDALNHLKLADVRKIEADYGDLPDLSGVDADRDVVFVWNGTTSGVRVPDANWIQDDRRGLTLCDATSAVFAMDIPWPKLDVTTFSWQKSLGGEAAHGMLVLSPRAVRRLESYQPPWPLPKIFRLTKDKSLNDAIFTGATINTPSMLCVEDYLDALQWAEQLGGLTALIKRTERNFGVLSDWVSRTPWVEFLAKRPEFCSTTSVCLAIRDDWFTGMPVDRQTTVTKAMCALLEDEGVAYDIHSYRDAPPGLRIWCGPTVESEDITALTPWLDWAFNQVKASG